MTDPMREAAMQRLKASIDANLKPLPCPFCESETVEALETPKARWFVVCLDCRGRTAEADDRGRAIRLWNGRRTR